MIKSTVADGLRVIEFDRPEKRNAITEEGMRTLREEMESAVEPVIYLSGAGEAFCAGADLDVVADVDSERAAEFAEDGQAVCRSIAEYNGVVVAGIDGPARGGGVEIALACDLRIGTPSATFAESGVTIGLFGAWGGTARLPRIVGEGNALDLSCSGRVIDAEEALRMGLISQVVEDPRSVVENLLSNDAAAMRAVKHRIRDTASTEEQESREADVLSQLIASFGSS